MKNILLIISYLLIYTYLSTILFNYVNAWFGIAIFVFNTIFLINIIYKKIKRIQDA